MGLELGWGASALWGVGDGGAGMGFCPVVSLVPRSSEDDFELLSEGARFSESGPAEQHASGHGILYWLEAWGDESGMILFFYCLRDVFRLGGFTRCSGMGSTATKRFGGGGFWGGNSANDSRELGWPVLEIVRKEGAATWVRIP